VSVKILDFNELAAKVSVMLGRRNRGSDLESLPSSPLGSQAERIPPHSVESHSLLHQPGLGLLQSSQIVTEGACALGVASLSYYVDRKLALTFLH
jgi:hypothetical protein